MDGRKLRRKIRFEQIFLWLLRFCLIYGAFLAFLEKPGMLALLGLCVGIGMNLLFQYGLVKVIAQQKSKLAQPIEG